MHKYRIITAAAALLAIPGAYAQYFGTPFYTEGFESAADLAKWTVNTELAPTSEDSKMWSIEESGFDEIDATSTHSLAITVADGDKIKTTLTSPVIDATGKRGLFAGLFGKDAFQNNYNWIGLRVYYQVKEEGTDTWETIYESPNSCFSTDAWGWYETRTKLPAKYDGKKLRLRIQVESTDDEGVGRTLELKFDGAYVAENYGKEAAVTAVTPTENTITTTPSTVTVKVLNNGKDPMSGYKVAYSVNGGADVEQTVNETLQPGEEKVVTFIQTADFTEYGKSYELTGKVTLDGDMVPDNNEMSVEFANILTSLPYSYSPTGRNDTGFWEAPEAEDSNRSWYVGLDIDTRNYYHWTSQGYGSLANEVQLFTRPVMLTAGQNATATFTTYATGSGDEPKLEVYWVKYEDRHDLSKCTLLQTYTLNKTKTAGKVNFQAPADGAYCLMFFSKPVISGMVPAIKDFAMDETAQYDGAILSIDTPAKTKDEYSTAESVTITVGNTGLQTMSGAKARLSLNSKEIATETLPDVAAGTTAQYTFNTKADLSQGQSNTLTAELLWDQDSDPANNSASGTFTADLAAPPYSVTLYNNDFATHWSWTDNNQDGNTFALEDVYGSTRIAYNAASATIPTTDETLYARTLRMQAGKTYKLTSRVNIWSNADGSEASVNCAIDLYKVVDDKRTFVKSISESTKYTNEDGNVIVGVTVPEDGKYCIAFHLTKDSEVKSKIGFQEMAIQESGDVDLRLQSVTLPGTTVSGYNTLPFSVRVTNDGLKPVSQTTLKVTGATIGEISEPLTFSEGLNPGASATIFISKPLEMNITGSEEVSFELVAEGDVVPDNNSRTITFTSQAPLETPVDVAISEDNWLIFDCDKNGRTPDSGYYGGFDLGYGSNGDQVMSPTFKLAKDTPYHITYGRQMRGFEGSGKVMDLYLLDIADNSKTPCGTVVYTKDSATGYSNVEAEAFTQVAKDGTYALVFEVQNELGGSYPTLSIGDNLKVTAMEQAPDFKMVAITAPAEAAVFTDSETVTATYKNVGTVSLKGVNFTLTAGEKTYYAYVAGPVEPEAEGSVSFEGVDLYAPGDYELTVTAQIFADKTLADNSVTRTLHSNFVYEVNMLSIDGPDNGPLTAHEHVKVSIKNEGHGDLVDTPVTMVITDNQGSAPVTVNETIKEVIKEGETLQYTFEAESDFSRDATYTVAVSINLEGDTKPENNTVTATILSTHEDMDAGVTAIVGPTQRRMTKEEYLVVKVKNYSDIDIYRVPVKATVSRGGETVATAEGTVPEIAKGQEVEFTFTAPVDIERGGTYTVTATTALPGDVDTSNDSCEGEIYAFIKDCGVARIISPEATTQEGRQNITVEIKNFGDYPMSDIPVYFKLGNNPQADKYEGELKPGESVEFTFKSQYNFRANREYTLTAYTAHPEDENAENDECVLEIKPTTGIAGVYAGGAIVIEGDKGAVNVTVEAGAGRVEVYTASGMRVADADINGQTTRIDLTPGMYVVNVTDGRNNATAKVVVR